MFCFILFYDTKKRKYYKGITNLTIDKQVYHLVFFNASLIHSCEAPVTLSVEHA